MKNRLDTEEKMGFEDSKVYDKFGERVEKTKHDLLAFLNQEVKKERRYSSMELPLAI